MSERDGLLAVLTGIPDPSFNPAVLLREPADPRAAVRWAVEVREGVADGFDLPAGLHPDVERALAGLGHRVLFARPAMAAAVADLPPPPPGLDVRPVATPDDLEAYARVQAAGFGMPADVARRSVSPAGGHLVLWTGDRPVAAAAVNVGADDVGVFAVTTVPEERGRGHGTAVTAAAVELGRRAGVSLAWLQASEQGRPVYRRMGFREIGDWAVWTGPVG